MNKKRSLSFFAAVLALCLICAFNLTAAAAYPPVNTQPHTCMEGRATSKPAANLTLDITEMTSVVSENTAEFALTAKVTNRGSQSVTTAVRLAVAPHTPVTLNQLENWLETHSEARLETVGTQTLELEAHKSRQLSFKIPKDALPLENPEDWGPRFLSVRAEQQAGKSASDTALNVAEKRTFLLWDSGASFIPSQLAAFVPFTVTANDASHPDKAAARLEAIRVLAGKTPLTLAVDPLLITPEFDPTTWANTLLNEERANPKVNRSTLKTVKPYVFLPPGDYAANLTTALNATQRRQLQQAAANTRDQLGTILPEYSKRLVVWPNRAGAVSSYPRAGYAQEAKTWGASTPMLVDEELLSTWNQPKSYTPDARREIRLNNDTTVLGWQAESQLSDILQARSEKTALNEVQFRQWGLAATAVLTRERPFQQRLFVAAASRDYAANAAQTAVITALAQARWIQFPNFKDIVPDNRLSSSLNSTDKTPRDTSTPVFNPAATASSLSQARALAKTFADPQPSSNYLDALALLEICSTCAHQPVAHTASASSLNRVVNLLEAQPASVINLIDKSAKIPVSISNGFNQLTTVRLEMRATDKRLQLGAAQTVSIPPHSISQVRIPVRAVGSGNLKVGVTLQNLQGEPLGKTQTIKVRVRAEWESTGTYVLTAFLAAVLMFGIGRKVLKGKRRHDNLDAWTEIESEVDSGANAAQ